VCGLVHKAKVESKGAAPRSRKTAPKGPFTGPAPCEGLSEPSWVAAQLGPYCALRKSGISAASAAAREVKLPSRLSTICMPVDSNQIRRAGTNKTTQSFPIIPVAHRTMSPRSPGRLRIAATKGQFKGGRSQETRPKRGPRCAKWRSKIDADDRPSPPRFEPAAHVKRCQQANGLT
jgi:hypothetical protein